MSDALRREGSDLRERLRSGDAKVGVIGLGYAGFPRALAIAKSGVSVLGLETDAPKVDLSFVLESDAGD